MSLRTQVVLTPFDLRTASDADYRPLWQLSESVRMERRPEDPPRSLAVYTKQNRHTPAFVYRELALAASESGDVCGFVEFTFDTGEHNTHLAHVELNVHASARRQGVGRAMLEWAVAQAQAHQRSLLMLSTSDRHPAGAIFAERLGATPGLANRVSQLVLANLDRHLLADWQARASERASDFELLFWDNIVPESDIVAFAKLCEVMNSAPRDQLDVEDEQITPERVRSWMASMHASGYRVWTMVARERSTGALAGVSELFSTPDSPTILHQGATAVEPTYRNRGLGRWLKAAMLDQVLRALPEARYVRTGNAESNAAMLAINVALGFTPYEAITIWQADVARVAAYLEAE